MIISQYQRYKTKLLTKCFCRLPSTKQISANNIRADYYYNNVHKIHDCICLY